MIVAPTLLVTRPLPQCRKTALFLQNNGFRVLSYPLFRSVPLFDTPLACKSFSLGPYPLKFPFLNPSSLDTKNPFPSPSDLQGTVVTSSTSLTCLSTMAPPLLWQGYQQLPLYAVGDNTACYAKELGFSHVVSAKGTANDLKSLVETHSPPYSSLFYPHGHTHRPLHGLLPAYHVIQRAVYRMDPCLQSLPSLLKNAFKKKEVWGVLLFSQQTASYFSFIFKKAFSLSRHPSFVPNTGIFFCISSQAAKPVADLGPVAIPRCPTQEALCRLILHTRELASSKLGAHT